MNLKTQLSPLRKLIDLSSKGNPEGLKADVTRNRSCPNWRAKLCNSEPPATLCLLQDSPKPVDKWAKAGPKMSEEEAIAAQQKMFAEARARMQVKSGEQL